MPGFLGTLCNTYWLFSLPFLGLNCSCIVFTGKSRAMVLQLATVQHGMKARATAPVPALHVQTQPQILLVGLGPHARRIYMHYFAKHKLAPAAVVELAEKQSAVTSYLAEKCLTPDVHFVDNAQRDADTLSPQDIRALDRLILRRGITHVILSTEPKAHMAYLRYFISRGIHTLTDKPITAPVSPITDATQAARIEHDYDTLMAMYAPAKAKGMRLSVQCQRRFHPGYVYIRQLLATLTATHNIPVTHMDVYHCDGMWNMPDEYLSRENHPYKYGYGKLYHSGYHFVDLAAWLLQGCQLTASKQPDSATLFSDAKRPLDCMAGLNGDDYANLLGTDRFSSLTD
ncbi:MAG: hypothetical protein GC134_02750, partial [Proteobacteria bacterium]|nr:hypothetical protein [Pseudomonadota bacterium]